MRIIVDTMYVDQCQYNQNGKSRVRTLLRTSYREGGKVKHQTIANISQCSPQEIEAIRFALKHKNDLDALKKSASLPVSTQQGLTVGSVFTLQQIAKRLGIATALGRTQQGRLALWLIIDQGSRLSAVRLARQHAACDLIGMDSFDEEDLYATLDWLADQQDKIEDWLFPFGRCGQKSRLNRNHPLFQDMEKKFQPLFRRIDILIPCPDPMAVTLKPGYTELHFTDKAPLFSHHRGVGEI